MKTGVQNINENCCVDYLKTGVWVLLKTGVRKIFNARSHPVLKRVTVTFENGCVAFLKTTVCTMLKTVVSNI